VRGARNRVGQEAFSRHSGQPERAKTSTGLIFCAPHRYLYKAKTYSSAEPLAFTRAQAAARRAAVTANGRGAPRRKKVKLSSVGARTSAARAQARRETRQPHANMFNIAQQSEVNVRDRFARTFVRAILRRSDLG
jgi:hypothetical protein